MSRYSRRKATRKRKVNTYSPTKDGCNFCLRGVDPSLGQSICDNCVHHFMTALRSKSWRDARLVHLDEFPLCAECGQVGDNVHHTKPWRQYPTLFWYAELWQTLCQSDHSRHTVAEDGGFGRRRKSN